MVKYIIQKLYLKYNIYSNNNYYWITHPIESILSVNIECITIRTNVISGRAKEDSHYVYTLWQTPLGCNSISYPSISSEGASTWFLQKLSHIMCGCHFRLRIKNLSSSSYLVVDLFHGMFMLLMIKTASISHISKSNCWLPFREHSIIT